MKDLLDKEIESFSYEEAFERLQEILNLLEEGKISLDDSIKYYEQGMILKNHCEKKLKNAEMKIKTVINNPDKKDQ